MSADEPQGVANESTVVPALIAGRATLLVGQRHSAGLLDSIKRDIAAITGRPARDELVRLLSVVREESAMDALRRAFEAHPIDANLVAVADNPWALVLTSAFDSQIHQAFQRAAAGRQLRVLFAGQPGTLTRSRSGTLTLLRLFGALEEREPAYRPPTTDLELRKRSRLELARTLNELPVLIGPGGQLVVTGVGSDDWLDLEDLALACSDLPAGAVHWFATQEATIAPERLVELFGDQLRIYPHALPTELERASATDAGDALRRARQELLHPAGRLITTKRGQRSEVVSFAAEEWRRLSQVAVVLDDQVLQTARLADEQKRLAFREFLYRVQHVPDWQGVARGFLFEREAAHALLEQVEREVESVRSVHATDRTSQGEAVERSSRLPIVIEGAPASGKSRLLHWLAFQLKRNGRVVIYVPSSKGRTQFEQIERVCRLLERKTQVTVVVIADDLDVGDYEQLSEILASSGRRAVVVGALNALSGRRNSVAGEDRPESREVPPAYTPSYRRFELDSRLTADEAERFLQFLADRGFPELELAREIVRQRLFLLLLYRLLPDSRGNIRLSVAQEYERFAGALEGFLAAELEGQVPATWQSQLAAIGAQLFAGREDAGQESKPSPFYHESGVVTAVQLALFCSQIERPLPLDLLLRTQSTSFLTNYSSFSRAMEETALLQETLLDAEGTVGVEAEHPFVAEVALSSLLPDKAGQLGLLRSLVQAIRWDDTAFPGENPEQDYVVGVLQAVGPRGAVADQFKSHEALEQVVELLGEVRVTHSARLPQLLLLEANAKRMLADGAAFEDALGYCEDAAEILADAEEILTSRRASGARNAQLQNVLTTRAVVHGFVSGACLRAYRFADQSERERLRGMLREHLDEVNRATTRARSMGRASYFPLDVSFWAHRDQLEQLPDLSDEEWVSLAAKLESVLEIAEEEPIEPGQYWRYQRRIADLASLQGDIEKAQLVAADLRARGDYSADCLLARRKAMDPATRSIRSAAVAQGALDDLLGYSPAIFGSEEALALMHHLWLGIYLPGQVIGGEDPVLAACTRDAWLLWRRILEGRVAFPASEANPYLNFCLAWTLLSLDEPVKAVQVLRANVALSIGNRRRIGTLAIVTDTSGLPVEYSGTVRRIDGQEAVVYVPRILSEIRAGPRVQSEIAVSVHVGDEWRFGLGLNYQGVLPVALKA